MKMAKTYFHINPDTLSALAKEYNVYKDNRRKYSLNENYFEEIDSPDKAYWLGFLEADGCITKDSLHLIFSLQTNDKQTLIKFLNSIESNAPIKDKTREWKGKTYYLSSVDINSVKLCLDLIKLGCTSQKSYTLEPPVLDEDLIPYWILGYMDGDGSISITKDRKYTRIILAFTGTYSVLSFIKEYFKSNSKISKEHRCKNTYRFHVTEGFSIPFLSYVYSNPIIYTISLDRKRKKFLEYMEYRKENINGRS